MIDNSKGEGCEVGEFSFLFFLISTVWQVTRMFIVLMWLIYRKWKSQHLGRRNTDILKQQKEQKLEPEEGSTTTDTY